MYPDHDDLVNLIPKPSSMCVSKLLNGMISTDTCNTARLTRSTVIEHVYGICRSKGMLDSDLKIMEGEWKSYASTVNGIARRVFVGSAQKLCHLKLEIELNHVTLSAVFVWAMEPHRNVDDCLPKTFILSSLFQVVASIIYGMYGSEQLKYFYQERWLKYK